MGRLKDTWGGKKPFLFMPFVFSTYFTIVELINIGIILETNFTAKHLFCLKTKTFAIHLITEVTSVLANLINSL
jgi:hypothetical protein